VRLDHSLFLGDHWPAGRPFLDLPNDGFRVPSTDRRLSWVCI
jgi:hypothetical protein